MSKTFEVNCSQLTERQAEFVRAAVDVFEAAQAAVPEHGIGAMPLLAPVVTDWLNKLAVRLPEEEPLQALLYDAVQTAMRVGLGPDPDGLLPELAQRWTEAVAGLQIRVVGRPDQGAAASGATGAAACRLPDLASRRATLEALQRQQREAWPERQYDLETSIVAGLRARVLTIGSTIASAEHPELAARRLPTTMDEMVERLLAAVRAGCFHPGPGAGEAELLARQVQEHSGTVTGLWQLSLPATSPAVAAALVAMADTAELAGVGVLELSVAEEAPAELARVPIERLGPLALPEAPFELDRAQELESKWLRVVATFEREDADLAFDATERLFRAWAELLSAGAFSGSGSDPYSTGYLVEVTDVLADEIAAQLEFVNCAAEATHALVAGFVTIHHTVSPLVRIEFR